MKSAFSGLSPPCAAPWCLNMWLFLLLLSQLFLWSKPFSYMDLLVSPKYKLPSTTVSSSFFPAAPSLNLLHMFSCRTDVLVELGSFYASYVHVMHSFLPQSTPSHRLFRGKWLIRELPFLSTTFIRTPSIVLSLVVRSFILLRSSPPSVYFTKSTVLYSICSFLCCSLFFLHFLPCLVLYCSSLLFLTLLYHLALSKSFFLYLLSLWTSLILLHTVTAGTGASKSPEDSSTLTVGGNSSWASRPQACLLRISYCATI